MTSPQFPCEPTFPTADTLCGLLAGAGACAAGVCSCAPVPHDARNMFMNWLARGCHGTMDYLDRNSGLSADPSSLLEGARTVACAAFCYKPSEQSDRHPLFADYARGADYHKIIRRRLKPVAGAMEAMVPGSRTRICVDTAPVRERYWAVVAGLGHIGLNGLLIVPDAGSKVFLGEILWTADTAGAAEPAQKLPEPSCAMCGACVRACPGGALDGRGGMDARRCLSYLTIEYRGNLPENLALPGRVYGCDICQDVCPENRGLNTGPLPEFMLSDGMRRLGESELKALDDESHAALFSASAARRATLSQLLRNIRHRTVN